MSEPSSYAPVAGIVARSIAGETILVPVTRRAQEMGLFTLNEVGSFVWEQLASEPSLAALTDAVVRSFEIEAEPAEQDLRDFLRTLVEAGCAREMPS